MPPAGERTECDRSHDAGLCMFARFWLGYRGPLLFWFDSILFVVDQTPKQLELVVVVLADFP